MPAVPVKPKDSLFYAPFLYETTFPFTGSITLNPTATFIFGHPVADGQFVAVGGRPLRSGFANLPEHNALSAWLVRKNVLFDRPKGRGRTLIFLGVIMASADRLFGIRSAGENQNHAAA